MIRRLREIIRLTVLTLLLILVSTPCRPAEVKPRSRYGGGVPDTREPENKCHAVLKIDILDRDGRLATMLGPSSGESPDRRHRDLEMVRQFITDIISPGSSISWCQSSGISRMIIIKPGKLDENLMSECRLKGIYRQGHTYMLFDPYDRFRFSSHREQETAFLDQLPFGELAFSAPPENYIAWGSYRFDLLKDLLENSVRKRVQEARGLKLNRCLYNLDSFSRLTDYFSGDQDVLYFLLEHIDWLQCPADGIYQVTGTGKSRRSLECSQHGTADDFHGPVENPLNRLKPLLSSLEKILQFYRCFGRAQIALKPRGKHLVLDVTVPMKEHIIRSLAGKDDDTSLIDTFLSLNPARLDILAMIPQAAPGYLAVRLPPVTKSSVTELLSRPRFLGLEEEFQRGFLDELTACIEEFVDTAAGEGLWKTVAPALGDQAAWIEYPIQLRGRHSFPRGAFILSFKNRETIDNLLSRIDTHFADMEIPLSVRRYAGYSYYSWESNRSGAREFDEDNLQLSWGVIGRYLVFTNIPQAIRDIIDVNVGEIKALDADRTPAGCNIIWHMNDLGKVLDMLSQGNLAANIGSVTTILLSKENKLQLHVNFSAGGEE